MFTKTLNTGTSRLSLKSTSFKVALFAAALSLLGTGCAQNVKPSATTVQESAQSCQSILAIELPQAVEQAKTALASPGCQAEFDGYFNQLIEVAKENPKTTNEEEFGDYLVWCAKQGIISKAQSQKLYQSYFRAGFTSTPRKYSVCHAVSSHGVRTLDKELSKELRMKQTGMMDILNDPEMFKNAAKLKDDLLIAYEAMSRLCRSES